MAGVEFEDYSVYVKDALDDACLQFLEKAAIMIQRSAEIETRMTGKDGYDVKGSWAYQVDKGDKSAKVGNPLEASYWEELGTGEYALNKDGRKGWWVYVEGEPSRSPSRQPIRTQVEAEAIAASMRADGIPAVATNGRPPNRPLHKAFTENKGRILQMAEQIFKGEMA